MSSKKKKLSCSFSSAKARPKKAKSAFAKEWATKLARITTKKNHLMKSTINNCDHEASEQAEMRASHAKISLQLHETVEAEEIYQENWTKLKSRSIVSGERRQECQKGRVTNREQQMYKCHEP